MSVKCGNRNYHGVDVVYHGTTAEVRECFAHSGRFAPVVTAPVSVPTQQQKPLIEVTVEEAVAKIRAKAAAEEQARRAAASARYAAWRTIPVAGAHHRGYYAVEQNGATAFYVVERPAEGRWAGKTFVKQQAGDGTIKMEWGPAAAALDAIAADPVAAGRRYGREIGRCYRCHRTLTDETSRAAGIGPDCATKE